MYKLNYPLRSVRILCALDNAFSYQKDASYGNLLSCTILFVIEAELI
jgi:predicted naringenin-chalcone synthase